MATRENYKKLTERQRRNRYFSEEFRRQKVREIEQNLSTIAEVSREYQVSDTAIRKWIYKYSSMRQKQQKQVVETESDTRKIKQLKQQLQELEQALGQKQLQLDFQAKLIELAEERYGIDIKKKFGEKPSYGSGSNEENTPTK